MKITFEENEIKSQPLKFPCLLRHRETGRINLFIESGRGFVVKTANGSSFEVGQSLGFAYSDILNKIWNMKEYEQTPIQGSVTFTF